MRQITLKIAAGKVEEFNAVGDYVRIKSASVPVRIVANGGQVDATIEQGDALNLKPFERLSVSHSDAAEQTIILFVGNGSSADSARVGGSVSVSALPVNNGVPAESTTGVGVTSQVLRAANTARKYLFIQNIGATIIWVRFTAAGSAALNVGLKLSPGDAFTMEEYVNTDMIKVISDAAGGNVFSMEG